MAPDNETPIPETLDVGNDTAAITEVAIQPMRTPALKAGCSAARSCW